MPTREQLRRLDRSKLRDVLANAASPRATRSATLAHLDQLGITDQATRERVVADATTVAKLAREQGPRIARAKADELVLAIEQEREDGDYLAGPPPRQEPEADHDAIGASIEASRYFGGRAEELDVVDEQGRTHKIRI